jgi:hypothetical protein
MRRRSVFKSAVHWLACNATLEWPLRATLKSRYIRIRYEDFVRSPKLTLERILRFIQHPLPEDVTFVNKDRIFLSDTGHTVSGNPNRFTSGEVEVREDQAWRHQMPAWTRHLVTAISWPLLWRYGYLFGHAGASNYDQPTDSGAAPHSGGHEVGKHCW